MLRCSHRALVGLVLALAVVLVLFSILSSPGRTCFVKENNNSNKRIHQSNASAAVQPSTTEATTTAVLSAVASNSATGTLFSGEPFRSFGGELHFPPGWQHRDSRPNQNQKQQGGEPSCSHWAVVTTISGPTEAVLLAANLPGWCTVVVADNKTPQNYTQLTLAALGLPSTTSASSINFYFLSVQDQENWAQRSGPVAEFVRSIPYNHFARKNIGYIYAILHGAKVVFDFDDDNILLKDPIDGSTLDPLPNRTHVHNVRTPILGTDVLNHHKLMKASIPGSWARGFPLDQLQNGETLGKVSFSNAAVQLEKFAVLQYCADKDPDVDAVHRLVKPLPMNFDKDDNSPLQVPRHAFAPYNAQASIHTYNALWATALPYSVPGRVSDIWRGYFAEAIFRSLGISVAFLPPRVRQDRNVHNYLADMQAELALYFKTSKLIEFLTEWSSRSNIADTVPEQMEQLWIQLFERGYIEESDVQMIQLWLLALEEIGYAFPPILSKRIDNVVLMGQFNYPSEEDHVVFWVQKWRELFAHVIVRIPENEQQSLGQHLKSRGIKAFMSRADDGYCTPYKHLAVALKEYKDSEKSIEGVMYMHDDFLFNSKMVFQGKGLFPSDEILGSRSINLDTQKPTVTYHTNGEMTFLKEDMKQWYHYGKSFPRVAKAINDNRLHSYKQKNGDLLGPHFAQSDFLYMPTKYADEFSNLADVFYDNQVFLEVAIPTIVYLLHQHSNATYRYFQLCTKWDSTQRGGKKMLENCLQEENGNNYALFHPFKISAGLKDFSDVIDKYVLGYS